MRLLNVYDFKIESGFPDRDLADAQSQLWHQTPSAAAHMPNYAILSHRWIGQEVTFQDFQSVPRSQLQDLPPRNPEPLVLDGSPQTVQGNRSSIFKIAGACNKVRETDHATVQHIWIDTICIDKSNAQELSTSINSMFRWYKNAEVCYIYLFDVSWDGSNNSSFRDQFLRSEWFLRGWTLQELLAPKQLRFFDRDWKYIGSKDDLVAEIANATHIETEHLLGNFRSASLAQKMSWLAGRTTTVIEDRAYCMLGIFGIYLEARYGQGEDEFLRLQEEILRNWDKEEPFDESLFAWTAKEIESSELLAPAPGCFRSAGNLLFDRKLAKRRGVQYQEGIDIDAAKQMTFNVPRSVPIPQVAMFFTCGIPYWFTMLPKRIYQDAQQHLEVKLNCWRRGQDGRLYAVKIKMEQTAGGKWRRVECDRLYDSTSLKLYPSRKVALTELKSLKIPRVVKYKS